MAASVIVRKRQGDSLGDIASFAQDKRLVRRLNRPAEFHFRIPSYLAATVQSDGRPLICSGYRMISVSLDSTGLFFHGIAWIVGEDGDEDMCYSQVSCYDPMVVWRKRPARDNEDSYSGEAGNFSDPSFFARNQSGPQIMEEILNASESAGIGPPEDAEGSIFLDLFSSTFETGGSDLSGAPTNFPMTIADVATLLTNTGELDIVIEPIVSGDFMGRVHCHNGDFGVDRTGSVHFDYGTGDNNAAKYRRLESMEEMANKKFDYLGPKKDQQHWAANVTGDHPDLPRPPGGDVNAPFTGGDSPGSAGNPLGGLIQNSRFELGVFMMIGIYDNFGSEASAYPLFLRQWQVESLLRVHPLSRTWIQPVRNGIFGPGDFDIGDLIAVNIGTGTNKARVAESGAQRVYAYTIEIDDDSVEQIGEIMASPDQDAI